MIHLLPLVASWIESLFRRKRYYIRRGSLEIPVLTHGELSEIEGERKDAPIEMSASCHPSAGLAAHYYRGGLSLTCAKCGNPVCGFAIRADGKLPPAKFVAET